MLDITSTMESEVIAFVAEFTGVKKDKISPESLINDELGVAGDDGSELLEEFGNRFNVDISTINDIYFGPEGVSSLAMLLFPFYIARWLLGYKPKDFTPLPVKQLIISAEAGKWVSM